jgi:two-component system phosphate regulon sensor histidine kinase PhoR
MAPGAEKSNINASLINRYKAISFISLLVLLGVQYFLLYNTYKLQNEHYYLSEKPLITEEYGKAIMNDKLFPGGAAILDKEIYNNMQLLEKLYKQDQKRFDSMRQSLANAAMLKLERANNFDSLLNGIENKYHIKKNLAYALTIENISVTFDGAKQVSLYDKKTDHYYHVTATNSAHIGGTLQNLNPQNQLVNLTVSSPSAYSYRITFNLYVDTLNRQWLIILQTLPMFLLSAISIIFIVVLFYLTFRNWIKQKNIADMKSDFINSITHEFHTPLAAIIVANKNLQVDRIASDREKVASLTYVIERQADRLKTLFDQVLNITSLQHLQLAKEKHSLHLLLDEILLDYRLKLNDTNVNISITNDAEDDNILVDTFWLTTMLNNIFDNAIRYNQSSYKEIFVHTYNDHKKLLLVIEDNGIGMDDETRKHVFDKFYRHGDVLKNTKGLGLGLYYVKQCVAAHHWSICIESKPRQGSRFIITIPVS